MEKIEKKNINQSKIIIKISFVVLHSKKLLLAVEFYFYCEEEVKLSKIK